MKSFNKYISSILFSSAILLGLTGVSASANANQNNHIIKNQPAKVTSIKAPQTNSNHGQNVNFYNRKQRGRGRIYQTNYRFNKQLGKNRGSRAHGWYNKLIRYNRVAKTQRGNFVKTRYGWLNQNAFNQYLITYGHINYRMQVVHNGNLYNRPAHTNNAKKVATTKQLHLFHKWVNVNACADTNTTTGYYRFGYQGQNYWIPGQDLMFNLKAIRGHNHRLERIISYGERMIGHSKYNEKSQHYDCASFLHHIFAKGGVYIGNTNTYNQVVDGRRVNPKHLKRGDLIFFNTYYSEDAYGHKINGYLCHVAMYIGDGLILQDSPFDDNGGVDVSSLRDPMWNSRSKNRKVHKFNGIARRIL